MGSYLLPPLFLLLALIETSLVPYLAPLGVKPDLLLVLVLSIAMTRGLGQGILWGILAGWMLDLLGASPFGTHILALGLVALLVRLGTAGLSPQSLLLHLGVGFVGSLLFYSLLLLILELSGSSLGWGETLLRIALPASIMNALLLPVAYHLLRGWERLWPERPLWGRR